MPTDDLPAIAPADLRVGLFVHLDLSWMAHPFASNRFKISSQQQIDTIRSLGLTRLRYDPARSDPVGLDALAAAPTASPVGVPETAAPAAPAPTGPAPEPRPLPCERQYHESVRAIKSVFELTRSHPERAGADAAQWAQGVLAQLALQPECALRLLTEASTDRTTTHALNVAVLCLLLGRSLQLAAPELNALALAGLWHDVGKIDLPHRVRQRDDSLDAQHLKLYQEHVALGLRMGQRLQLDAQVLEAIAQHHELADGSGFPRGLTRDQIAPLAQVLALVNRYDGLCNPYNPVKALTPHEALSHLYSFAKAQFDARILSAFIRLLGIYPPGSVVQLSDERYALVLSVNATRPLKPRLRVYNALAPDGDALWLDLQQSPELSISRSLRPDQLPRPALTQLAPRPRVCYYFEPASAASACALAQTN